MGSQLSPQEQSLHDTLAQKEAGGQPLTQQEKKDLYDLRQKMRNNVLRPDTAPQPGGEVGPGAASEVPDIKSMEDTGDPDIVDFKDRIGIDGPLASASLGEISDGLMDSFTPEVDGEIPQPLSQKQLSASVEAISSKQKPTKGLLESAESYNRKRALWNSTQPAEGQDSLAEGEAEERLNAYLNFHAESFNAGRGRRAGMAGTQGIMPPVVRGYVFDSVRHKWVKAE